MSGISLAMDTRTNRSSGNSVFVLGGDIAGGPPGVKPLQLIREVRSVKATGRDGVVTVYAMGVTSTFGWTRPQLLAECARAAGVISFTAMAEPPETAMFRLDTFEIVARCTDLPSLPTHVLVRAESNEVCVPVYAE